MTCAPIPMLNQAFLGASRPNRLPAQAFSILLRFRHPAEFARERLERRGQFVRRVEDDADGPCSSPAPPAGNRSGIVWLISRPTVRSTSS